MTTALAAASEMLIFLKRFHLNSCITGFCPQTQQLEPPPRLHHTPEL